MANVSRMGPRVQIVVCALVAVLSVVLLSGALWWMVRPHATVRPMSVSAAIDDQQARDAAESTVRAWISALNARNVPNLRALSCERPERKVAIPFSSEEPDPALTDIDAITTGLFERDGDLWKLPVFYRAPGAGYGGKVFSLSTANGVLRVCDISVPEPW